jgi:hypothetical protein
LAIETSTFHGPVATPKSELPTIDNWIEVDSPLSAGVVFREHGHPIEMGVSKMGFLERMESM